MTSSAKVNKLARVSHDDSNLEFHWNAFFLYCGPIFVLRAPK